MPRCVRTEYSRFVKELFKNVLLKNNSVYHVEKQQILAVCIEPLNSFLSTDFNTTGVSKWLLLKTHQILTYYFIYISRFYTV